MSEFHIVYHGAVTPPGVRNLEALLHDAVSQSRSKVILHICSEGGDVNAGVGLYNFIKALSIPVDTHAFGECNSSAATIFLAGRNRSASPTNRFVLHGASCNGQLAISLTTILEAPFRNQLSWDDANMKIFSTTDDTVMTNEQAMALGIIQNIVEMKLPSMGSDMITVNIP